MTDSSEQHKRRMLEKTLEIIKKKNLSAYQIAQGTSLSTTGIQKIIDGKTENPQKSTVAEMYNYVMRGGPKLTTASIIEEEDFSIQSLPGDYDLLMDKIEHLRLMLKVKDEQLADKDALIRSKEELIQSLREQIAMKIGHKENDKHSNPRSV